MKKRLMCIISSFAVLFCCTMCFSSASEDAAVLSGTVVTNGSVLNIRETGSLDCEIVATAENGSILRLITKKGDWWKAEYADGKYGWCHADYIRKNSSAAKYVSTAGSVLNVRKSAGLQGKIKDTLSAGECVTVTKTGSEWCKITYGNGKTGYVSSKYLSDVNDTLYPSVILDTVLYKQTDSRWADTYLGKSDKTIAVCGCTTSCLAMSESYVEKAEIRPDDMERQLTYSYSGSLYWPEQYQSITDDSCWVQYAYDALCNGVPVIVGAQKENGRQHWVLIKGYDGNPYRLEYDGFLINDPASADRERLSELFSDYPYFLKITYRSFDG